MNASPLRYAATALAAALCLAAPDVEELPAPPPVPTPADSLLAGADVGALLFTRADQPRHIRLRTELHWPGTGPVFLPANRTIRGPGRDLLRLSNPDGQHAIVKNCSFDITGGPGISIVCLAIEATGARQTLIEAENCRFRIRLNGTKRQDVKFRDQGTGQIRVKDCAWSFVEELPQTQEAQTMKHAAIQREFFDGSCLLATAHRERHDDPADQLPRVTSAIAQLVLRFVRMRGVGGEFHAADLYEFVGDAGAPNSACRILQVLKKDGHFDYEVLSRRDSLYRVTAIPREAAHA